MDTADLRERAPPPDSFPYIFFRGKNGYVRIYTENIYVYDLAIHPRRRRRLTYPEEKGKKKRKSERERRTIVLSEKAAAAAAEAERGAKVREDDTSFIFGR